jgi:hypothetical protein
MVITSRKKNIKLWKKIVKDIKKSNKGGKPNQWSARKAQLCVKIYKEKGGKYIESKKKNNSLHKWTIQKWRTKSGEPSLLTGERYLPEKAIKNLSKKEYKKTSLIKKKSLKENKQYSKQPINIVKKINRILSTK